MKNEEWLATLGPDEQPNGKERVRILAKSETNGFFRCITEDGRELIIRRNKLKEILCGESK